MSSPTNAVSKSPKSESRSTNSSEHEDDELSKSLDHMHVKRANSQESAPSAANSSSRPASRNAAGNHRSEQFHQMLKSDVVDLDKLRELSWGGIPVHHRPTAWRLLLVRKLFAAGHLGTERYLLAYSCVLVIAGVHAIEAGSPRADAAAQAPRVRGLAAAILLHPRHRPRR